MRVLSPQSDEVFLVEGHTDACRNDVDNLSLSDRRAEAVAEFCPHFGIPPEPITRAMATVPQGHPAAERSPARRHPPHLRR